MADEWRASDKLLGQIRDLIWPGVHSWRGKGLMVEDFYVCDGGLHIRLVDGSEHIIVAPDEIANSEYKDLFAPRMKALLLDQMEKVR